jgi:hypothetical protein
VREQVAKPRADTDLALAETAAALEALLEERQRLIRVLTRQTIFPRTDGSDELTVPLAVVRAELGALTERHERLLARLRVLLPPVRLIDRP